MISIVIPARDEERTIGACLRALRRQSIGPERLEVIVVAGGGDRTAEVATREGAGHFGRFEIVPLAAGNKKAALQAGCARARGEVVLLLDADTQPAGSAVAELLLALDADPRAVVHGAAMPQVDTWVSRYWELNRRLLKDLRFDGTLSGEMIALPRAAVALEDLPRLFPEAVGPKDDLYLGRALQQRGWHVTYAARALATTLVPFTWRGLLTTLLRSRRGAMHVLPLRDAALQAGASALLLATLPAALLAGTRSGVLALCCAVPLLLHVASITWRVVALRRRGLGDFRRALPAYIGIDMLARGLKLWAFLERLADRQAPLTFRGERPTGASGTGAQ